MIRIDLIDSKYLHKVVNELIAKEKCKYPITYTTLEKNKKEH